MRKVILSVVMLLGFAPFLAWGEEQASSAKNSSPFFAMDTAVRSMKELDVVKRAGYQGIGWKECPADELRKVLEELRARDLKLFAIYSGATLNREGLSWSTKLEDDMRLLKGSGAVVWLPIRSRDFAASAEQGDELALAGLGKLADLAAENEVSIVLYPHTGFWMERVQDAVRLAAALKRREVGVTFNLCHCLMVGDEREIPNLLTAAAPHLKLVTINGADREAGRTSWQRLIQPLDQGSFDVKNVLHELKRVQYTGPIGLQGYGVPISVEENLTRSATAWRGWQQEK